MLQSLARSCVVAGCIAAGSYAVLAAAGPRADFGLFVADQLRAHAEQLFGFRHPLEESALGPYDGADSTQALQLADGLKASVVSTAVHFSTDQIAMWPDDENPRYLFVCDEEVSDPAVQRVDLQNPDKAHNAVTLVKGLSACDPVRRTPWGTIIVAEEAGAEGGLYELIDPANINSTITVSNRGLGTTSDPLHLVKRKKVGSLSFESFAIKENGEIIYGDELAPSGGKNGGGIYKFVPSTPYAGGAVTVPAQSPLSDGSVFGLRVANAGSSNWGQGAETGKGLWVAVNLANAGVVDADGDIILRTAQGFQLFTGFYRPEDMDIDPVAKEDGVFRACWANTGRMSHVGGGLIENGGVNSEIMCLVEEPPSTACRHRPRKPFRWSRASCPARRTLRCTTTSRSSRTPATSSSWKTGRRVVSSA